MNHQANHYLGNQKHLPRVQPVGTVKMRWYGPAVFSGVVAGRRRINFPGKFSLCHMRVCRTVHQGVYRAAVYTVEIKAPGGQHRPRSSWSHPTAMFEIFPTTYSPPFAHSPLSQMDTNDVLIANGVCVALGLEAHRRNVTN